VKTKNKRGISEAVTALILISIAITVGILVWTVTTSTARNISPKGGYLIVENVIAYGGSNTATVYAKNAGQTTINITQLTISGLTLVP